MNSFEKVIRSILELKDNDLSLNACKILDKCGLEGDYKDIVRDIKDCIQAGGTPTISNFIEQYQGSVFRDEEFTPLDKEAVLSEASLYFAKRRNALTAKEFMHLSEMIAKDGYSEQVHALLSKAVSNAAPSEVDVYEDPLDNAKDLYEAKKLQGSGMKFGVEAIDEAIGGLNPGSFNVIFAFTGSYKSTSAINIAYNNSFNENFNICYLSFEVTKEDLMCNIYSTHSFRMHSSKFQYLPHDKIRHAQLTEKEQDFYYNEVIPDYKENRKGRLYLLDETDFKVINFMSVEKKLREMDSLSIKENGKGLDCVIVDQAQLLKYGGDSSIGNEGSVINAWVSFFRQQCIDFLGTKRHIVVIMLSQANREGWKRAVKNEGRYDLRGISEANELERSAWRVFSIFTDENMKQSKEAKVQCLKNRTGLTVLDPVVVFADPVCYTFGDVADGFNDQLDVESIDDIFSSEFDNESIFD